MKIVFIVGSISDSHITKRIESFCEKGFEVEVYGYTRDLNFSNVIKGIEPQIVGSLVNGKYVNRILSGYKVISKIINKYPKDTLYYLWGFDIALVHCFRNTRYIYEISDIRYANFPVVVKKLFRYLDRKIISRSICTPITSEGFIRWINHIDCLGSKYILLPNKLSPAFADITRDSLIEKQEGRIRIAYAGMYRYPNTVVKLAEIIGKSFASKYEFHFFGKGDPSITALINRLTQSYNNVYEHGPFKNPDDLIRVYNSFDVVACNYDTNGVNERIAEPNKLYESIFFNKPILVTKGTFLSAKVQELGIGFETTNTEDSITSLLEQMDWDTLIKISKVENSIDKKQLIESYDQLWKVIEDNV